jgi:hypothetical protein
MHNLTINDLASLLPEQGRLNSLAAEKKAAYQQAEPYPHIVIDDLISPQLLDLVLDEFPKTDAEWKKFKDPHQVKLASKGESLFQPLTKFLLHYLNSQPFLAFLEQLTGIEPLVPDPDFSGGGLHQIVPGGLLKIHADYNKHPRNQLDRRLNVIIYLNKNWQDSYGGHFELWDKNMQHSIKKVSPLFNRLVIFSTSDFSYHGHPDPLQCPPGMTRKSLALYYFSNGRPETEISQKHTTVFKSRNQAEAQTLAAGWNKRELRRRLKETVKLMLPPILLKLIKKVH